MDFQARWKEGQLNSLCLDGRDFLLHVLRALLESVSQIHQEVLRHLIQSVLKDIGPHKLSLIFTSAIYGLLAKNIIIKD